VQQSKLSTIRSANESALTESGELFFYFRDSLRPQEKDEGEDYLRGRSWGSMGLIN
jgi:hypothetical protein